MTSDRAVASLSVILRGDLPAVGAKAANLGELLQAGFPVPDGFVIHSHAFGKAGKLASSAREEVRAALASLGGGAVAVRSSGVAEDMPDASFAGQYESVLGVTGPDAVLAAIQHCWESGMNPRVQTYQASRRLDSAPMAVLVQCMVEADAAGVAFTANPVSGDRKETLVSAVRGLGERLVSGEATPDEWSIRDGRAARRNSPEHAITRAQALEVAALARQVEAYFGAPQDIEWALAGRRLFLLQARPITVLPSIAVTPSPELLEVPLGYWQRDASHWPEPTSPVFRFIFPHITRVSRELDCVPLEEVTQREIGGWLYVRLVPIGGKERKQPPPWLARLLLPVMFRVVPQLRAAASRAEDFLGSDRCGELMETWYREWLPAAAASIQELQDVDRRALDDIALEQHLAATVAFNRETWRQHLLLHMADLPLPAELAFFCQDELGWDDMATFEILSGLSSKTTEPAYRLAELAEIARRRPAVEHLLQSGRATLANLEAADAEFGAAFRDYQRSYGCRALRLDPAEKTVAECPELVVGLIRDQLQRRYDPGAESAAHQQRRESALSRARKALARRPTSVTERFEYLAARAQRAYPIREDNEFYLVSAPMALLRYALLEVGRRLTERRQVRRAEDVFFLEIDEVSAALRAADDCNGLVERRRGEQAWVKAHPGPDHYGENPGGSPSLDGLPSAMARLMRFLLWGTERLLTSTAGEDSDAARLAGVAGSAGSYRGPVCVIKNEAEFGKIRVGDVLVCPSTSPVWSVIFPSVGALVTDAGGILAHAALIAREYRVPAVLATCVGTEILRDGQIVTVDGTMGVVHLEA